MLDYGDRAVHDSHVGATRRDRSRDCFFFQAEDGIRDYKVTGVQTCALPISSRSPGKGSTKNPGANRRAPSSAARFSRGSAPAIFASAERAPLARPGPPHDSTKDRKSVV